LPGVADVGEPVAAALAAVAGRRWLPGGAGGARCKRRRLSWMKLAAFWSLGRPLRLGDQCWTLGGSPMSSGVRFGAEYTLAGADLLLPGFG